MRLATMSGPDADRMRTGMLVVVGCGGRLLMYNFESSRRGLLWQRRYSRCAQLRSSRTSRAEASVPDAPYLSSGRFCT